MPASAACEPRHLAAMLSVAFVASLPSPAPARADEGAPFAYRSEEGRFSVDLPTEPPTVRELTGSKFTITDNDVLHSVVSDGAEYSVEIHDIPRLAELMLTSHYILERSVEGMLEDMGGRAVDTVEASYQGQPAREVAFEIPERSVTGKSLLVLAERRLYLVTVQHSRSDPPPSFFAPFFASFSFWLE